ncbi:IS4 family transposase [Fulvivirga maritima]|uniref:IS4 family transposase n=1 Tax=Fulvivirga maritima TaxID=2904247 RepID=UPI001F256834|nr:IS4 family transposase [Fulvivirga maritima]UII25768.1 IS4 family transposase [Fulvivirga maritima]
MHTLLDYDGKLPIFVNITEGSVADNKGAYGIPLEKGAVIVADRYYNDFPMINVWDSSGVYFVIRHKKNLSYTSIKERDLPEHTAQHVLKDEEIELSNAQSKAKYPKTLRRVVVWDERNGQTIEVITNNFKWAAQIIGELYKARWEIEVFFRDVKQLLHIKTFVGTSKNAVMIQIWTALITILLLKVMKATAKYGWHLSNLVAFIRLNIFVKIELQKWLDKPFEVHKEPLLDVIQGDLFSN